MTIVLHTGYGNNNNSGIMGITLTCQSYIETCRRYTIQICVQFPTINEILDTDQPTNQPRSDSCIPLQTHFTGNVNWKTLIDA